MKNTEKAEIVEAIAQYHSYGSKAIEEAFTLYNNYGWEYNQETFEEKVKGVANSRLQEINNFDFMYDADKEDWASNEVMVDWYNDIFNY